MMPLFVKLGITKKGTISAKISFNECRFDEAAIAEGKSVATCLRNLARVMPPTKEVAGIADLLSGKEK